MVPLSQGPQFAGTAPLMVLTPAPNRIDQVLPRFDSPQQGSVFVPCRVADNPKRNQLHLQPDDRNVRRGPRGLVRASARDAAPCHGSRAGGAHGNRTTATRLDMDRQR